MSLPDIHFRLYIACAVYSAVSGAWAFWLAFRGREMDSNFMGTLVINELLFVAAGVLDLLLLASSGIAPARTPVHLLYTATGVLSLPAAYTFTGGRTTTREAGIYGAVCLFLAGIAIRAIVTSVV
jgi:hypothetical protein